jgi:hypothetical protein
LESLQLEKFLVLTGQWHAAGPKSFFLEKF